MFKINWKALRKKTRKAVARQAIQPIQGEEKQKAAIQDVLDWVTDQLKKRSKLPKFVIKMALKWFVKPVLAALVQEAHDHLKELGSLPTSRKDRLVPESFRKQG